MKLEALGLRELLELRTAVPADVADGTVLLRCDLPGSLQLYTVPLAGGELTQLTDGHDPVDGHFLGGADEILLERDHEGNEHTQLWRLAGGREEGVAVAPDFIHRDACLDQNRARIAYATNRDNGVDWTIVVHELATAEERTAFAPGGWTTPVGFSPDGKTLAVQRESGRTGDNDLYLVDLGTADATHITPHDDEAWFDAPVWTPDGSAFFVANNAGRDTRAISRYDVAAQRWDVVHATNWDVDCHGDDSGRWLLIHENDDGYSRLELLDRASLDVVAAVPLPGRGVVEAPVFSRDGASLAFKFSSSTDPGDVWTYAIDEGALRRLTELARPIAAEELTEPELHRYTSFDGESVPVFLWEPEGEGPFPVVVMVHGGPESQFRPGFLPSFTPFTQHLVSRGYAVAAPNVRGSTGYGKRYEHLDDVRLRLDSVRDLAALHDWLATRPRVDQKRAALYGRSYGGYMVLAGLAFQPERWAAGIECVGISNFVTFLENTAPWRRAVREPEYGSLENDYDFLVEASPITHVDAIRAPLFIQHGANDPRVPLSETKQIHRVLTEKGIRCDLLVHEDEGHAIGKIENRVETFEKAAAFLDAVL
jgi:dipeptidyl aminopeptidase/acylaminoacyl peptidase